MSTKNRENVFHLTVQDLEKYNGTAGIRGWHQVNRQGELLTGGGRGGRWWSRRIVSNRRWRGTAISLMPDVEGTGSDSLLSSMLPTLLEK